MKTFFIIWIIMALLFVIIFFNIMTRIKNDIAPESYSEIKRHLGKPLESFGVTICELNGMILRGFWGKIETYDGFILLKLSDRCLRINNINDINVEKKIFCKHLILQNNGNEIACIVDDKQIKKIFKSFDRM